MKYSLGFWIALLLLIITVVLLIKILITGTPK